MAQTFPKRPAPWHIAGRAWASTIGALFGLLPFYAVMAGLLFAFNYGVTLMETKLIIIPPANDTLTNELVTRDAWFFAIAWGLRILILAPAGLAALRYVLVDDGPRLAPGALLRFMGWIIVLTIISMGSLYISGRIVLPNLLMVGMVLKGFAVLLPVTLLPVLAAVAADSPKGRSRIESGLENWEANLWRLVFSYVLTLGVALLLLRLPPTFVAHFGGSPDAVQTFQDSLPGMAVGAVLLTVITVLVAATLAWWYAWAQQNLKAAGTVPVAAQGA